MLLGVIADDFTGASDIANTLAKGLPGQGGLATAQFIGVPDQDASPDIDAGVISLKSRSIPAADAIAQSLDALRWLQGQGCRQFVFKYCSTFDSTAQGNIGPVAEALADALGVRGVVVCPAFPAMGRTVYQGHLFVHDRLLNESGMQDHPVTPMTDPDLHRWLQLQSNHDVGLVPTQVVRKGAGALALALEACAEKSQTLVVVDATADDDLITIGRACATVPLLTGGSGIGLALPANFIEAGLSHRQLSPFEGNGGPEAILAGSCSGATRGQIDEHARSHPVFSITVEDVLEGRMAPADIVNFISRNHGRAPLAYSSGSPENVAATQAKYGRSIVSDRLDQFFAETARQLVDQGVRRLVVAGGETSGAVAQALDLGDLMLGPEVSPGVPVLVSKRKGLLLALKSGNFGGRSFFEDAMSVLAGNGSAAVHQ